MPKILLSLLALAPLLLGSAARSQTLANITLAMPATPLPCPASHVAAIELPHARATLARNHELLIVAFGSSSTVSWMSTNIGHSYPAILQDELNARLPQAHVAVINRGIGGQGAAQELPRLETDVLPIRPQIVVWQVGANDALRHVDPALFRQQLMDGIARLQQANIDVVLMDNQRSPRLIAADKAEHTSQLLANIADRTGADLFARGALMDQWQSEGFPYASFTAADRLHHNDRGYRCIADALAQSIAAGLADHPRREAMREHGGSGG